MGKTRSAKVAEQECQKTQEDPIHSVPKRARKPRRKKNIHKGQHEEAKSRDESEEVNKPAERQLALEDIPVQYIYHQQHDYICPLCLNYIARAVSGPCGHSFCEICISEYLLFFDECIQCSRKLRNIKLSYNRMLDSLIETFVASFHTDEKQIYEGRIEQSKNWNTQKKPLVLEAGVKVDIRDTNYVWCSATIYRTVCKWQQNRTKFIFVMYDGKDKRYNQEICEHSNRIAPHGFYTTRKDIPHYQLSKQGQVCNKEFTQFQSEEKTVLISNNLEDN